MRIAVTGGSGFIGSHLVDRLLLAGHEPVVLDLRPPHRPDVESKQVDVLDAASINVALAGCEAVFHLAAVADVNEAFEAPADAINRNVVGTARVLDAAMTNGVDRFFLASTVWVYGSAAMTESGPLDERSTFDLSVAAHVYTASKVAAEMVVQSYAKLYGQKFTILRYGVPFGPRMRPELVISRFVELAKADQPITIQGDGSAYRRFVYVEDLADAHIKALAPAAINKILNLEGDVEISVREIVDAVAAVLGRDVRTEFQHARPGDFAGLPISGEAAARVLGWRPTTAFAEGLRRYVLWLDQQPVTS